MQKCSKIGIKARDWWFQSQDRDYFSGGRREMGSRRDALVFESSGHVLFSIMKAISLFAMYNHFKHSLYLWCIFQFKCVLNAMTQRINAYEATASHLPAVCCWSSVYQHWETCCPLTAPCRRCSVSSCEETESSLLVQWVSVFPRFFFLCQMLSVG